MRSLSSIVSDDPVEPSTLTFYPHAVVAPGQGFFVETDPEYTDTDLATVDGITTTKITFNRGMQAQSRFGMIEGNGTTYKIVVGQAQVMRKMYDSNDDGILDTDILCDSDNDGILDQIPVNLINAGNIWIDTNGDDVPDRVITAADTDYVGEIIWIKTGDNYAPKTILTELVYETDGEGQPVTDSEGNKIPKLIDVEEDVVIYKYVPEALKLADNSTVDKEYPLLSRRTRGGNVSSQLGLVIIAQRNGLQSSALVMQRESASDDFLPMEDTETFISIEDLKQVPTVYTLCGRLATTINSIRDFRCLPLGVESNSDALCTLTFRGVEMLGDSIAFYDAVEQKLTPLESGMSFKVSGQTQNRYYLVRGLNLKEAAEETHLQIFTEGRKVKVIASTEEPIISVRCFDTGGRMIYSASPERKEYEYSLPGSGVYIIEAQTEKDRKTKKVMTK